MENTQEKQQNLSQTTEEKGFLQKIIPLMKKDLVGFTEEVEDGIMFTLPGGKQYKIVAHAI
ncbi:MAG: hypothetical protein E7366_05865 [Clostridiales bacterium]|nr:hypothetical protein [Clostridiales bacterium]